MDALALHFLAGGGDMGARTRATDWRDTPLGDPQAWASPLRTLVAVMFASSQPVFVLWGDERTLIYNDAYALILGAKHPGALGRPFLDVWHEIRGDLEPIVETAYAGEPVQMDDIELLIHRHGYPEETHFSFFYSPTRDDAGEVRGVFCACAETTARVLAERRLVASEARYRGVLANMDEAFTLMDREMRFLELNSEGEKLLGMTGASIEGRSHWDVFQASYESPLGAMYRAVLEDGRPRCSETHAVTNDGRDLWCEVRAYAVDDGLAVFFRDISERRRARQEAALATERVQLALDAGAIVGTWVWSIPDDVFVADERFAASFGLDPERCRTGLPLDAATSVIAAEDLPRVTDAIAAALDEGGHYRCEYRVRQYDGSYRWVEAIGRVEFDAAGRPSRFPGVLLDHEARRRTEDERDRATALLRTFIEAVPGVVYAKDREGRLTLANRGTAELLGMPPERFLGRTDAEVLADPEQAAAIMANDRRIMDAGVTEQIEEAVQLPDGRPAVWLSTKAPLRDGSGEVVGLIGASIEITDRKRMEDALRLSEQRSALAFEVAQVGLWVWDLRSDCVSVDARTREICGLPPDEAELALQQFAAQVHPDDWPRVEATLTAALNPAGDGAYAEEFRWRPADGRTVWTLSRGQVRFEGRGPEVHPVALIGSVIDVTERRRMLDALEQADRRKDEFLAMLAHELRNPLAPIGTAAQLLQFAPTEPDRVRSASQVIARQVGHMTAMVDDLLDVSRVSRVTRGLVQLDSQPVELRAVLSAAIEQVEPLIRARRHRLVTDAGAGHAVVMGDRQRLVQVVSNLLNNAAKYTPPDGRIELGLETVGAQVRVRVRDNGIGMDETLLPHVFDLFTQAERTPDRTQGGLGIGLALVRSIVQLHGGRVAARSDGSGTGSTFEVLLPLAREVTATTPGDVPLASSGARRVLVVDDNQDAADTLATLLEALGHDVDVAHAGADALARVSDGTRWDAFVLDIGMPDMTGYELAATLRELDAARDAMLIALTGYGHSHDRAMSRAAGFDHHLVKPADIAELQRLLGSGAARVA